LYELFIAKRYLRAHRANAFLSVITWISIGGVAVGVAALLVVLAVMNGFRNELRDRILGTTPHVVVLRFHSEPIAEYQELVHRIELLPHVTGASPFILTKVMVGAGKRVDGIALKGIDVAQIYTTTKLNEQLVAGDLEPLKLDESAIVLGADLADQLRVHVGDTVSITSVLSAQPTVMGMVPRVRLAHVCGLFDSGMYEYDVGLAYLSMSKLQDLLGMPGAVTGIEVRVDDIYRSSQVANSIERELGYPYRTTDWQEMNGSLFAALKLEKTTMFVILILIVVVAAFNIVSTLIMIVRNKTKEIGILRSMGSTAQSVMKIFILEGLLIGSVGTAMGVVGGMLLSWIVGKYRFISLPEDVYFIDTLPVHMEVRDFLTVCIAALLITLLATIYPARKASQLTPVEAIREE
jgi:lipoprotein-releasing system permease protein